MNDALNLYKKSGFYYISKPIGVTGHDVCDNWLIKDLKQ
jgi:hypothetical protein